MLDWVRKKDPHAIQRWPTLGCEEKTQVLSPSWCTGTIRVSECMVWLWCGRENEKETEWLIFCGQKNVWRGDTVRSGLTWMTWLSPRDMVISVPGLLLGSMSGFMALMISMALDITQGQEYRVLQSWPCPLTGWSTREKGSCPSLSEAPRRESPTPHLGNKIELTVSWPWGHENRRAGHACQVVRERFFSSPFPPAANWWPDPTPQQSQRSGEWALCLAWVTR